MTSFQFPTERISYTKAEKKIINYIYQHPSAVIFMSIQQLSEALGISESTISRFSRHAGYEDFKALKHHLQKSLEPDVLSPADKISRTLHTDEASSFKKLLQKQIEYMEDTIRQLDFSAASEAAGLLASASQTHIFGKGASRSLAQLLHFRLGRFGKSVHMIRSAGSEIFEDLIHIRSGDCVLLFGFQKVPLEVRVILDYAKKQEASTILFTSQIYDSPENRAYINLYAYRGQPEEYHSMTVPTALADALVVLTADAMDMPVDTLNQLHQLKESYSKEIPR